MHAGLGQILSYSTELLPVASVLPYAFYVSVYGNSNDLTLCFTLFLVLSMPIATTICLFHIFGSVNVAGKRHTTLHIFCSFYTTSNHHMLCFIFLVLCMLIAIATCYASLFLLRSKTRDCLIAVTTNMFDGNVCRQTNINKISN